MRTPSVRIVSVAAAGTGFASILWGLRYVGTDWMKTIGFIVVVPVLIIAVIGIYKARYGKKFNGRFLAEVVALVVVITALVSVGGELLYHSAPHFDSFVHFTNGALLTILIVLIFGTAWENGAFTPKKALWYGGVVPAVANEIYEVLMDRLFGTQLWGDPFKPILWDTASDVLLQIVGSGIGVLILRKHFNTWLRSWRYGGVNEQSASKA